MQKYNTENLPITIGGAEHMVNKSKYAKHIANELSITLKADIGQKNVIDLIQVIEAGKPLSSDNPEEWHKAYAKIETDIKRAQEIIAENDLEAKKKAEEQAAAAATKEKNELALAEGAKSINVSESFSRMGELFDLGESLDRCVVKEGVEVSDADLMAGFATALRMGEFSNWAKGDLIVQLEDRGHDGAMQKYCEATGTPYQSVYRMAVTARAVKPTERVKGVSFTSYQEVATARLDKDEKINDTKRAELLNQVGKGAFENAAKVREAVKAAAGKTPPPPKDPMAVDKEEDIFIVVNYDERNTSQHVGLPAWALNDSSIELIHARTVRAITDTVGNRLAELPKAKDPNPPQAATPEPVKKGGKAAAAKAAPEVVVPNQLKKGKKK